MRPVPRTGLLVLAVLIAALPACSKQAPPAPVPDRTPPPPAMTPPAPPPVEPPAAGDWQVAETPPQSFLSADEINARQLLKTIYFDYDRAEIRPDQRPTLQANAAWLRDHAGVRILLEGHCDERGTREYNQALGDRRAQATRDYLISLGIAASRIEMISYGEEIPKVMGQSEQAWAQNRRAEFVAISAATSGD